jgi:glucosamine 6-phosphate synthetase-like amidotransferase/phosphosugar isomerase protein
MLVQIMKGGFDHYMQKEIHEQPESLLQTMRGRVQFQRPAVSESVMVNNTSSLCCMPMFDLQLYLCLPFTSW